MRAINHALVGSIVGLTIETPAIALPLAFISHFALDAVPHHGSLSAKFKMHTWCFKAWLVADAIMCGLLVLLLLISQPKNYISAIICAFLAASPDLYSLPRFLHGNGLAKKVNWNWFRRFHKHIQWFERPIGIVTEIAAFIGGTAVVLAYCQII